ncbi:MAG: tetratricopeptide repeat protein [Flavobacteriales bacterium]|nr:tetratricopeptide repeat protein [Flavobacteriales bacterium]
MNIFRPSFLHLLLAIALTACGGSKGVADGGDAPARGDGGGKEKQARVMELYMDATRARLGGDMPKAISLYEQCLREDPTNAAAQFELAKLYHMAQDWPRAVDMAKKAVANGPDNIWYRFLLADLYNQDQRYNEAAETYRGIVKQWPDRQEVYFSLARTLAASGRTAEAAQVYRDLEQRIGTNEELVANEFDMLAASGQYDEAEKLLRRAIAGDPANGQYHGMLADLYSETGQPEKALEEYRQVLAMDPGDNMARVALAEHYFSNGERDKAFDELNIAFADPDLEVDAKMQVLLGFFEMSDNQGEEPGQREQLVRRSYELIATLKKTHPESGKPHTIAGDFLMRDGKTREARDEFREALRYEQDKYPIWQQVLQLDLQLQDWANLQTDAAQAAELFPTQPEFHWYNGVALSQLKRYDEAIEALVAGRDLVVDNPPLEAQFWSALGDAYHEAGTHAKSDEAYDRALAIDGRNASVLNNYAYYLSERGEKLQKAEEMSRRSNELQPGQATYQDTYAWVLYKLGRYPEARTWMEKALAGNASDGVLFEHYGDILFKLGETGAAMEQWRKAKAAGGASDRIDRKIAEGRLVE